MVARTPPIVLGFVFPSGLLSFNAQAPPPAGPNPTIPTMRRSLPDNRQSGGDQRFLTFMLLSVSILMFSQLLFPAAPPVKKPVAEAEGQQDAEPPSEDEAAPAPAAGETPTPEIAAGPEVAPQRVALGSAQVDGPYRMLMTLDNRGAAVTRVEMSTHEFRDLDDDSGYLGELGLIDAPGGGAEVTVVGPGTPADEAGIQVGDVLRAMAVNKGGGELPDAAAVRSRLAQTNPGDEPQIVFDRGGAEQTVTVKLTRRPLAVVRPESENIRLHNPQLAEEFQDVPSFRVTLATVNKLDQEDAKLVAANKQLVDAPWQVVQADSRSATFRMRLAELGLEVEKEFHVIEVPVDQRNRPEFPGYHFDLKVRVKNLLPTPQSVSYQIEGPNGLPIEGYWYANRIGRKENGSGAWSAVGLRDVIAQYYGSNFIQYRCSKIVDGDVEPMGQGGSMAYLGVDAQYFSVVMIPLKEDQADAWFEVAEAKLATEELPEKGTLPTYNNTTFTAKRKQVQLEPVGAEGDSLDDAFEVFAGPKRDALLEKYLPAGDPNYGLNYSLYYGYFAWVVRPMLVLLHAFYGVVGNYGIAIIMLTICVRGAMFPLSRRQAMNMAKMAELKPEMDRIVEKYKDDIEKRTKAQQDLYRKHNFNPMGGCLLMFVQLPIFIGLYRALAVDIELRQAPLFSESIRFCSNLGAPDACLDWSWLMPQWFNNGQGMFALGPYFNLLPIITIVLFLLQQKMFMPPPANEQAELQQKMMKYMMVFFGIMFFKVPSGLCLYFIASSLWGIAERKLLPKPAPPEEQGFSKPAPKPTPKPGGGAAKKSTAKKKKKKRR